MSGSDQSKAGAEPSMDDILASIRKILNEDDVPNAVAPTIPEPPPEPLMLTEEMLVSDVTQTLPPPGVQMVPPPEPVAEAAPPPQAPSAAPSPAPSTPPPMPAFFAPPAPPEPAPMPETILVAPAAAAAAAASMNQLLRAVTQERSSTISRGGPTIEDVVREEVRPLLKEWLDNHLPGIVERAVRAEIERVVGRSV